MEKIHSRLNQLIEDLRLIDETAISNLISRRVLNRVKRDLKKLIKDTTPEEHPKEVATQTIVHNNPILNTDGHLKIFARSIPE